MVASSQAEVAELDGQLAASGMGVEGASGMWSILLTLKTSRALSVMGVSDAIDSFRVFYSFLEPFCPESSISLTPLRPLCSRQRLPHHD